MLINQTRYSSRELMNQKEKNDRQIKIAENTKVPSVAWQREQVEIMANETMVHDPAYKEFFAEWRMGFISSAEYNIYISPVWKKHMKAALAKLINHDFIKH